MKKEEKKILLGNEAIAYGALRAGVNFVSGYPGCPSAEIGDTFGQIGEGNGVRYELSTNEKVALESAIGASFSGLKSLVEMKSFGLNVCSDSLLPLAYTGTKGPMVIVVADDPSCWSSAQSEQDSRGYAGMAHVPMLDPADPQEAKDFTELAYEISEKFNLPVILRTTTRVAHQRMPIAKDWPDKFNNLKKGEFVKDPKRFCTMPPRVLEMKKELLEKIEKVRVFAEKSKINKISGKPGSSKTGIIISGVSYLHAMEAMKELGAAIPILKLGFFYPLPEKIIKKFIKGLKKVLVVEEMEGHIESEVERLSKSANPKLQIFGKNVLPEIGEFNAEKIASAISKIFGKKYKIKKNVPFSISRRYPKLCEGCPYWHIFPIVKKIAPDAVFGGDIGCNMIAGLPPHNMQDYLFCMGASLGISHGVKKMTSQKVISIMGDGTFFHAGMPALVNAVYNKSNPLVIIADNRITAMTGHQPNPGMGKNGSGEDIKELKIEDIARSFGVKNIKVLDQTNIPEFEAVVKEFLEKDEVSVIICRRICALLAKRQNKE